MPQAASRDPSYRRRRHSPQLIEQCVRWYLTYRLSYRDLTAMMAEREVTVSHTTIMRWVRHYVPEYERRWSRFSKPTHSSWRMDETSVSVGNTFIGRSTATASPCTRCFARTEPSARRRNSFDKR